MRIRKLAKELGTDAVSLMALLGRLGHTRYTDPEHQLPAAIEAQVRRHAKELPKLGTNVLPPPKPAPVIPVEPVATSEEDDAAFLRAMAAVKPIGPQPKPARPSAPAPLSASVSGGAAGGPIPSGAGRAGPQAPSAGIQTIKAGAAPKAPAAPPGAVPPKAAAPARGVGFETLRAGAFAPAPPPPPAPTPAPRTNGAGPTAARAAPAAATTAAAPPPRAHEGPPVGALEWPPKVDRLVANAPAKGDKGKGAAPGARGPAVSPPKGPTLAGPQADRARADALQARLDEVESRAAESEAAATEAEARAAIAEERVAELEARLAEMEALADAREARLAEVDQHRRQLQRDLDATVQAPEPATLRACFERRGLLGDDEIAAALRALVDGHRVGELARLAVASPDQLEELLWERVLLLGEDETPPAGVVAVRVPAERSEGRQASVNRAAMSRFATACLVRNIKRVVIVGGSPAYHRTLREGLDPRLEVKLIPGNRRGNVPAVPGADLVILWASTILDHSVSAQFPEGVVIPHRGIARMLGAATDWIEARPD